MGHSAVVVKRRLPCLILGEKAQHASQGLVSEKECLIVLVVGRYRYLLKVAWVHICCTFCFYIELLRSTVICL